MTEIEEAQPARPRRADWPRRRIHPVGWIALGFSILVILDGWWFIVEAITGVAVGETNIAPDWLEYLGELFLFYGSYFVLAAVVLNIIAGLWKGRTRILGIVGGVVLFSPAALFLIDLIPFGTH